MGTARMDGDKEICFLDHCLVMRPGDSLGGVAFFPPGIDSVHVVGESIERIPSLLRFEGRYVKHGHSHDRPAKASHINICHELVNREWSFRFVTMDSTVDPKDRAVVRSMEDDDRD